jgi:AMP nucleosidase
MIPDGVKTDASDQKVTENFVQKHLQIGIDALEELANSGESVKHLRFD